MYAKVYIHRKGPEMIFIEKKTQRSETIDNEII